MPIKLVALFRHITVKNIQLFDEKNENIIFEISINIDEGEFSPQ